MTPHHKYMFITLGILLVGCVWLYWRHTLAIKSRWQIVGTLFVSGALFYGFFWVFTKNYSPAYESINQVSVYDKPFYSLDSSLFIYQDGSYESFQYVEAATPNNLPILIRRIYPNRGSTGQIYNTVYYSKSAKVVVKPGIK